MSTQHNDPSGMTNDEMTREIYKRIVGDGTAGNPGLDKRVDRLEEKTRLITWLASTSFAAAIAGVIKWAIGK